MSIASYRLAAPVSAGRKQAAGFNLAFSMLIIITKIRYHQ
jgi:hypothetical protein